MKYIHTIKGSFVLVGIDDFTPSELKDRDAQTAQYHGFFRGFFRFLKFVLLRNQYASYAVGISVLWLIFDILLVHDVFMFQGISAGLITALLISIVRGDKTIKIKNKQLGSFSGVLVAVLIFLVLGNGIYYGFNPDIFFRLYVQLMWVMAFAYVANFVKFFRAYKAQKLLADKNGNCYIAVL